MKFLVTVLEEPPALLRRKAFEAESKDEAEALAFADDWSTWPIVERGQGRIGIDSVEEEQE